MGQGQELCFTAASCSEAVLAVCEDLVGTQVPHDATGDVMLLDPV